MSRQQTSFVVLTRWQAVREDGLSRFCGLRERIDPIRRAYWRGWNDSHRHYVLSDDTPPAGSAPVSAAASERTP